MITYRGKLQLQSRQNFLNCPTSVILRPEKRDITPFKLDTSSHSQFFITNFLWQQIAADSDFIWKSMKMILRIFYLYQLQNIFQIFLITIFYMVKLLLPSLSSLKTYWYAFFLFFFPFLLYDLPRVGFNHVNICTASFKNKTLNVFMLSKLYFLNLSCKTWKRNPIVTKYIFS